MTENYTIYIKDPKTGETKKVSFGNTKKKEEQYAPPFKVSDDSPIVNVDENITVPVKVGDTILMGKFKNKKVVVKTIDVDEHGMPTINGKKVVTFRKLKEGIHVSFDDEEKKEKEQKKLGDKDVGELLNEIIDTDKINVEQLKIKDKLCPDIWDSEDKMNPEVRQVLLKNALEFIKFSKLEKAKFKDIILTGSLANYNWHEGSDLDVHVLMDYNQISDDNELVSDYFKTKKSLWGEKLPIKVKNHDVELYVQDINEPHTSTGVFSLLNDRWLTKPIKTMIAIDIPNIRAKAMDFMNKIDDLASNVDIDLSINEIDKLMDKLKAYRKAGLDDEGEFSTENLVFKVLRNTGYLKNLTDLKENILVKTLTLENNSTYDSNINETNGIERIKNSVRKGTLTLGVVVGLLAGGISAEQAVNTLDIPIEMVKKAQNFILKTYNDI